jgi:TPR repeat protein
MSNSMEIANYYFFEIYMEIKIAKNYKMEDFVKLDKAERDFLLYMLEKGARAGDSYSAEKLIYLYRHGVGVDKNVTKADSLQKVIDSFIEN